MFQLDSKKSPYSHFNQKNFYVNEMNYIYYWYPEHGALCLVLKKKTFKVLSVKCEREKYSTAAVIFHTAIGQVWGPLHIAHMPAPLYGMIYFTNHNYASNCYAIAKPKPIPSQLYSAFVDSFWLFVSFFISVSVCLWFSVSK